MPCLASRVAYGVDVTPERMQRIDHAERFLREHGFGECRVRYHNGNLASVEVPTSQLTRLQDEPFRTKMQQYLLALGFSEVTIDPAGFRSGSLNESLPDDLVELKSPRSH